MYDLTISKVPENFKQQIGVVEIVGVSLPIYSNGDSLFVSDQKTYDQNGRYLGIAYQCVEFVRRYAYEKFDLNLANCWDDGDADDWYANRTKMPLQKISLTECLPGDIMTFTGEKVGHIAIVKEVGNERIVIASQNLTNSPTDLHTILGPDTLYSEQPLIGQNDLHFYFESVLRVTK